ncbi:FecR family protein [Stenotrophomonas acidaminiphila]|jgi:transmembrane sensor|uniref:FecR family protein n=1 Tax=Stenotrophomonas acidaminiphila TaxID=128780 RepID=UPI000BC45A22|nr:FecR domain-containing protein [Stenotrophomonas acidaminiphila]OZB67365.1 MAG: hypothetical protein B7X39_05155 [Xanthomonadales bacterium 14-68-21]
MESSKHIEREAADWLVRMDGPQWSGADQAHFDQWIAASLQHRVTFLRLHAAWSQADRLRALGAGSPKGQVPAVGQWSRLASPSSAPAARTRRWRLSAIAAMAACLVLAVAVFMPWLQQDREEHQTAFGRLASTALSDGSMLTLSSDTRVMVAMSKHQRRVELDQGEAFFSVAKDKLRPFRVALGTVDVIAVGTEFSVRSEGQGWRVAVAEGVVRVEGVQGQPLVLRAGDVASSHQGRVTVSQYSAHDIEGLLSWRSGYLTFHGTPLSEAAAEFNRFNRKKIVIDDPTLASIQVGGKFKWSNAEAFVRLAESGFALQAHDDGQKIVLKRRQ